MKGRVKRKKTETEKEGGSGEKKRGPFVMYTTGGIDDCNYQIAVLKGH